MNFKNEEIWIIWFEKDFNALYYDNVTWSTGGRVMLQIINCYQLLRMKTFSIQPTFHFMKRVIFFSAATFSLFLINSLSAVYNDATSWHIRCNLLRKIFHLTCTGFPQIPLYDGMRTRNVLLNLEKNDGVIYWVLRKFNESFSGRYVGYVFRSLVRTKKEKKDVTFEIYPRFFRYSARIFEVSDHRATLRT